MSLLDQLVWPALSEQVSSNNWKNAIRKNMYGINIDTVIFSEKYINSKQIKKMSLLFKNKDEICFENYDFITLKYYNQMVSHDMAVSDSTQERNYRGLEFITHWMRNTWLTTCDLKDTYDTKDDFINFTFASPPFISAYTLCVKTEAVSFITGQ